MSFARHENRNPRHSQHHRARPYTDGRRERGGYNNRSNNNSNSRYQQNSGSSSSFHQMKARDPLDTNSISFGNFDFETEKRLGKKGGGMREVGKLLKIARQKQSKHQTLLRLNRESAVQERTQDLLASAMDRVSGVKVKDDVSRLSKKIQKRRQKKKQSAKKWAERIKNLQKSVDNVVEDRNELKQKNRMLRDAKQKKKEGRKAALKAIRKEPLTKNNKKQQKKDRKGGGGDSGGKKKMAKKSSVKGKGKSKKNSY